MRRGRGDRVRFRVRSIQGDSSWGVRVKPRVRVTTLPRPPELWLPLGLSQIPSMDHTNEDSSEE